MRPIDPVDNSTLQDYVETQKTSRFQNKIRVIRQSRKKAPTQPVVLWMMCGHHILCLDLLTCCKPGGYSDYRRANELQF